jgi:hypothetical protein
VAQQQQVAELRRQVALTQEENGRMLAALHYLQESEAQSKEERQAELDKLKALLKAAQDEGK